MNKPKVTVIIPAYNSEKFIGETIESTLNQTFRDFELVIIDDCSKDNTVKVIESYKDPRIKLIKNSVNSGASKSRNNGLEQSTGEYVAILDSDDLSLPNRFAEQVRFLDQHPDFGVVGTWTKIINENGIETGFVWRNDLPPEKIPAMMLFKTYITHSSAMIRRSAMPLHYYDTNPIISGKVEDYILWTEIMKKWKVDNIQQVLTKHRQHKSSMTAITSREKSADAVNMVFEKQLSSLGIPTIEQDIVIHKLRRVIDAKDKTNVMEKKKQWLEKLVNTNNSTNYYKEPYFSEIVGGRWFEFCNMSTELGILSWKTFWSSPLSDKSKTSLKKKIKFFVKCLIKKQ